MPNPGFLRLSVSIVALVALLYPVFTGEEMPEEQKQAWTDTLGNAGTAGALLYALIVSTYSKLFPSKPA